MVLLGEKQVRGRRRGVHGYQTFLIVQRISSKQALCMRKCGCQSHCMGKYWPKKCSGIGACASAKANAQAGSAAACWCQRKVGFMVTGIEAEMVTRIHTCTKPYAPPNCCVRVKSCSPPLRSVQIQVCKQKLCSN